jgi:hypothetical protein
MPKKYEFEKISNKMHVMLPLGEWVLKGHARP